jgi:hypothetical protein
LNCAVREDSKVDHNEKILRNREPLIGLPVIGEYSFEGLTVEACVSRTFV